MKKALVTFLCLATLALFLSMQMGCDTSEHKELTNTPKYRLLITHRQGLGETEMSKRVVIAARRLNMDAQVIAEKPNNTLLRRFFPNLTKFIAKQYKPDLILSLQGGTIHYDGAKKFITLTHGSDYYFGSSATQPINSLTHFDGFLVSFPDQERISNYLRQEHKLLPWFTTCFKTSYRPVEQLRLFYCGSNWSTTSFGRKYEKLFSRLDSTGYLDVYGNKDQWRHVPQSYRGFIKADGESIIRTMQNTGVSLVLHAPDHFTGKVPTARIFEAAAACNIIISDKHPFIVKHFKDSVLYIDSTKTSEEIFDQIDAHMKWIRENTRQALAMAKKAHKIFVKHFTLENQLCQLIQFYKTQSPSLEMVCNQEACKTSDI